MTKKNTKHSHPKSEHFMNDVYFFLLGSDSNYLEVEHLRLSYILYQKELITYDELVEIMRYACNKTSLSIQEFLEKYDY